MLSFEERRKMFEKGNASNTTKPAEPKQTTKPVTEKQVIVTNSIETDESTKKPTESSPTKTTTISTEQRGSFLSAKNMFEAKAKQTTDLKMNQANPQIKVPENKPQRTSMPPKVNSTNEGENKETTVQTNIVQENQSASNIKNMFEKKSVESSLKKAEPQVIGRKSAEPTISKEVEKQPVSKEQPKEIEESKNVSKITEEKPIIKTSEEKPIIKINNQEPTIKVNDEKPIIKVNDEKPIIKINDEKPQQAEEQQETNEKVNHKEEVQNESASKEDQTTAKENETPKDQDPVVQEQKIDPEIEALMKKDPSELTFQERKKLLSHKPVMLGAPGSKPIKRGSFVVEEKEPIMTRPTSYSHTHDARFQLPGMGPPKKKVEEQKIEEEPQNSAEIQEEQEKKIEVNQANANEAYNEVMLNKTTAADNKKRSQKAMLFDDDD